MRQKVITIFSGILLCLVATSCKTTAKLSSKVDLGMTKEQVIDICGKPYKQAKEYDAQRHLLETFFYKEKIWDGGCQTTVNHILIFSDSFLKAIRQGEEVHHHKHNKPEHSIHIEKGK